jgi:hypothetical protein
MTDCAMTMWNLVFQKGDLPTSIGREDGLLEDPPAGLIRYVELAHGAWTTSPATQPSGMEGVEWPTPCVWREVTGCGGAMVYVEHVAQSVILAATGERTHPAGWQCETCGRESVGGFSVLTAERTWTESD